MSRHIVVIGGGPAGIEAARTAVQAGTRVTLVSNAPTGGRAGWHSLLPSKVWLAAADTLGLLQEADALGIAPGGTPQPQPDAIVSRIKQVANTWNDRETDELRRLGVTLIPGTAVFTAGDRIEVKNESGHVLTTIQADAFIVAAGSVPRFPAGMKPDGKRIIAPRFASHLHTLPASIVVVGAGVTGSEFTYLFNRLRVAVTWIVDEFGVLPTFHADAGRFLATALAQQGVKIVSGQAVTAIEQAEEEVAAVTTGGDRYQAEMAFVAIGRLPDWQPLNLAAARLNDSEPIETDEYGRTANPHVYLVGDAAGGPMVANKALAQARVAARHAASRPTSPYNPHSVVLATYTKPQIAQVGHVSPSEETGTVRVPFSATLKAHLLAAGEGFVELFYHRQARTITGGIAAGPHAADVLAPVALAIQTQTTLDTLAELYGAYPTLSELAFIAARTAVKEE